MTAPELQAFHLGIVVRNLETTMKQYGAMFGIERWHRSKGRFNGLEMAYGLGPGQSLELFEVTAPGDSHIHQFLEQRGEGVNHIGIWAEDVAASVRKAIDAGAELLPLTPKATRQPASYRRVTSPRSTSTTSVLLPSSILQAVFWSSTWAAWAKDLCATGSKRTSSTS